MSDNILINPPPEYLVDGVSETIIQEGGTQLIETEVQETIVTIRDEPTIIMTAEQGPAGPPGTGGGGSEGPFDKLAHYVSDTVMYKGEATPGSATSAAAWRVSKMVSTPTPVVTYPFGTNFDQVWDAVLLLTS